MSHTSVRCEEVAGAMGSRVIGHGHKRANNSKNLLAIVEEVELVIADLDRGAAVLCHATLAS